MAGTENISPLLLPTGRGHAFQRSSQQETVQVNIEIMRGFVRLRQILASNADLARKLNWLEQKYDAQFKVVFDAIGRLMSPPEPKKKKIGFLVEEKEARYGRP